MTGTPTRLPVLTAVLALTLSGGHLWAGDLYNKEPVKTELAALPKPADVRTLANWKPNKRRLRCWRFLIPG